VARKYRILRQHWSIVTWGYWGIVMFFCLSGGVALENTGAGAANVNAHVT
jgi:hypothetical protein